MSVSTNPDKTSANIILSFGYIVIQLLQIGLPQREVLPFLRAFIYNNRIRFIIKYQLVVRRQKAESVRHGKESKMRRSRIEHIFAERKLTVRNLNRC